MVWSYVCLVKYPYNWRPTLLPKMVLDASIVAVDETTNPAVMCSWTATNPLGETVAPVVNTALESPEEGLMNMCTSSIVPGASVVSAAQLMSVTTRTMSTGMLKPTLVPFARTLSQPSANDVVVV